MFKNPSRIAVLITGIALLLVVLDFTFPFMPLFTFYLGAFLSIVGMITAIFAFFFTEETSLRLFSIVSIFVGLGFLIVIALMIWVGSNFGT